MAYEDFKGDKTFNSAKYTKCNAYQRRLALIYNFLQKKFRWLLKLKLCKNQLLENLKCEKYTRLLLTIFRALILQICNW